MGDGKLGWPVWIGVVADDMEAQRRFYRDTLGFAELDHGESWVWFDMGDGRLFEVLARSELPQYNRPRYQVGYPVEDIGAAATMLASRGVTQLSEIEGGPDSGQYWCYFADPEGNVFELAQQL